MKVLTNELEGPALDWAVAQAAGQPIRFDLEFDQRTGVLRKGNSQFLWQPSTDWSQGGPLIDAFTVTLIYHYPGHYRNKIGWPWLAACKADRHAPKPSHGAGSTILLAACRAIVAASLGPEVDVPNDLVKEHDDE